MTTDAGSSRSFEALYKGRRVLVTGHTGFTGSWLTSWLLSLGAEVSGIGLKPSTDPSLFDTLALEGRIDGHIADIRDLAGMRSIIGKAAPEIIFHLAAQPLVSVGYDDPVDTFATNVLGTANILQVATEVPSAKAVVCVTTDKVYHNEEWVWGYRETDRLGGKDPYSASKAAAEIVASAYQQTVSQRGNGVAIATARGGNIIGGGDFSRDRIVPDFVRAVQAGVPLRLRNPSATRPWQHVLALCHGYLLLASRLLDDKSAAQGWNFGPRDDGNRTVQQLVDGLTNAWRSHGVEYQEGSFKEGHFLHLDSSKAAAQLGWQPVLSFDETVRWTAEWYASFVSNAASAPAITDEQLSRYRERLAG
jgi:CDP-glucose 4,6-dehydratase